MRWKKNNQSVSSTLHYSRLFLFSSSNMNLFYNYNIYFIINYL